MSSVADHLADYYTNAKVQRLPLTYQISPSGLFQGKALKYRLLTKVFDLISISMLCGLSQSHFRLRGSERVSGLSQIWDSFSVGTERGKVRYLEHCRGNLSNKKLRKSELSVQLSMRLSRMVRKLRNSLAIDSERLDNKSAGLDNKSAAERCRQSQWLYLSGWQRR